MVFREQRGTGSGGMFAPVDAERCAALGGPAGTSPGAADGSRSASLSGVAAKAASLVAGIRDGVAALAGLDWSRAGGGELLGAARAVEAAARALYGVQVRLAGQADERGLAEAFAARSTALLWHQTLNVTVGEARARLAAAAAALPRETVSGGTVGPVAPGLIAAVDAGDLSAGQGRVVTRFLSRAPRGLDAATVEMCVDALLDQAAVRDENGLAQVAEQLSAIVDPDGSLSDPPEERAELVIGGRRGDGLTPIRGLLSPLTAEQLRVAVDALSAPRPVDGHTPDLRPAALRREQALGEILHRHLTAGAGPRDGGIRPQVVVTIDHRDLFPPQPEDHTAGRPAGDNAAGGGVTGGGATGGGATGAAPAGGRRAGGPATSGAGRCARPGPGSTPCGGEAGGGAARGSAWSDYGGVWPVWLARALACDGSLIPQVLGADSAVLGQGRAVRLFTAAQRRAITTRDRGCAFPGCDIPPAWTDAHHIVWWSAGGATDIDNGVLLCRRHHTEIHHGHWRIHTDPAGGRPTFTPPAHIDPRQQPRRNTHFHPPEPVLRR